MVKLFCISLDVCSNICAPSCDRAGKYGHRGTQNVSLTIFLTAKQAWARACNAGLLRLGVASLALYSTVDARGIMDDVMNSN